MWEGRAGLEQERQQVGALSSSLREVRPLSVDEREKSVIKRRTGQVLNLSFFAPYIEGFGSKI